MSFSADGRTFELPTEINGALLQSLRNRHGWDYQMMHALNMTVALHMDGRPTKRQAEVSCPAHSLGHPCVGLLQTSFHVEADRGSGLESSSTSTLACSHDFVAEACGAALEVPLTAQHRFL